MIWLAVRGQSVNILAEAKGIQAANTCYLLQDAVALCDYGVLSQCTLM